MFDATQIDDAVGEAFGTKVKTKPAPQPQAQSTTPAPIRTNNPGALMPGGKLAEYPSMEEGLRALDQNLASYGKKGINTLSGVISTWAPPSANDTNAYIAHVAKVTGLDPNQRIDLSNPLIRHQISAGITQMESGRKAIYNQQGPAPSFESIGTGDIDAAVNDAFQNPEPAKPQGATGKVAGKVSEFLRGQGRAAASLADVTLGNIIPSVAGAVTYAGARAIGKTPEQATEAQQAVVGATDKPFGKAFGVTKTPEYKGEASRQIMDFIGANMEKGADWISQQTGVPKADVENMMNTLTVAAPGMVKAAGKTKLGQAVQSEVGMAGQAVKQGVQAVTPQPVQRAVGKVVETVAPGTTNIRPPVPTPALGGATPQTAPYAQTGAPQPGRVSVGAAGVSDPAMIRQALQTATPEFQQLYGNMPLDKANTPVVMRHLEGDSLPVPVRLTKGQATGDLVQISREQNVRGRNPEIANQLQQQNQALVENVPAIRERVAPDVYSPKTIDSSTAIIDAYRKLDEGRNAEITQAYKALEDANGGQFPVDGATLAQNAEAALGKKLKTEFLPSSIKSQLDRFKAGEPMTFEQFEAMRTNLAAEIRKAQRSGDGNAAQAASIVREQLENLPMAGETAALKPLADKARALAKARFDALKKDPAYRAAVDDSVPADKFLEKFVINGHNKNVRTMVDTLGVGSEGHQHMAAGTINWLSDRAGIVDGRGNFSQANYNKALKKLDDANNLHQIFTPEGQTMLRTLGNVANYTQFQPRGSFVNNSNTLVGYLAEKGANALETGANVAGLKTIGYPIGSEARRVIGAAKERKFVKEALEPGAGSTLQEISKKGKP